jgi:competence CoiA-like predicted nuclease
MSLAALDVNGIKQISYEILPEKYRQNWQCPVCDKPMSFVDSRLKIKHFRHKEQNNCYSEPETYEHMRLKKFVYSWLSSANYKCEFEVKIGNRIADVTFLNTKTNKLRVVECQVSIISDYEAQQRTTDYKQNNVHEVYWILYPKHYLKRLTQYSNNYHLKDIERKNLESAYCFYFDPSNQQIKKLFFTPKWARGRSRDVCETIFWKEKEELIIKNNMITNWGMVENWLKGRHNDLVREQERKRLLRESQYNK